MSSGDREKHCANIVESLASVERGPATQKHIQLLNYCSAICAVEQIADFMVNHNILSVLAHHIKESQQIEVLVSVD